MFGGHNQESDDSSPFGMASGLRRYQQTLPCTSSRSVRLIALRCWEQACARDTFVATLERVRRLHGFFRVRQIVMLSMSTYR